LARDANSAICWRRTIAADQTSHSVDENSPAADRGGLFEQHAVGLLQLLPRKSPRSLPKYFSLRFPTTARRATVFSRFGEAPVGGSDFAGAISGLPWPDDRDHGRTGTVTFHFWPCILTGKSASSGLSCYGMEEFANVCASPLSRAAQRKPVSSESSGQCRAADPRISD